MNEWLEKLQLWYFEKGVGNNEGLKERGRDVK